jgi:hypothetical protein
MEQIAKSTTTTAPTPQNKIAAKWAWKLPNRQKLGILDTGATSGAAAEHDTHTMEDTGEPSAKVFMLPDKSTICATRKMLLKHNLRRSAREMNVVPGLHTTLVSIPKFADADYITVFDKNTAKIYDATTTTLAASAAPVIVGA